MKQPSVVSISFIAVVALLGIVGLRDISAQTVSKPMPQKQAISVDEVIRLVKAGIDQEIIIQQIQRKGPPAGLTNEQIFALKNASVGEPIIRAMLGASAATSPSWSAGGTRVMPAAQTASPVSAGGWTSHTDPMGFTVSQPQGWKVATEANLGRFSVRGDRGERVIIWPMFMEHQRLDERSAGVLALQLADKIVPQTPWVAPKSSGRYVFTSACAAQRKSVGVMTWANSTGGSTVLLYVVSAPAELYASSLPAFAEVLKSFRIVNTPPTTGGTAPKRRTLGSLQYVRWADPLEKAFTISVPQGWKVLGGMYRFGALDSRAAVTLLSPDGGILVKLGQKDFGAFTEPMHTPYGSMRGGTLPTAGGSGIQIQSYTSGQQLAQHYVQGVKECSGVRQLSSNNRQDLASGMMQEARGQGYPGDQITVGRAKTTGLVLPLGGNAIRRSLGPDSLRIVTKAVRDSIQHALDHREAALEYAMQFARDLDPDLADRFVSMYVTSAPSTTAPTAARPSASCSTLATNAASSPSPQK